MSTVSTVSYWFRLSYKATSKFSVLYYNTCNIKLMETRGLHAQGYSVWQNTCDTKWQLGACFLAAHVCSLQLVTPFLFGSYGAFLAVYYICNSGMQERDSPSYYNRHGQITNEPKFSINFKGFFCMSTCNTWTHPLWLHSTTPLHTCIVYLCNS